MPRKTVTVTFCAVCGTDGAERWTLSNERLGRCRVDLCAKCAKPVKRVFAAGDRSTPGRTGLAGRYVALDPPAPPRDRGEE